MVSTSPRSSLSTVSSTFPSFLPLFSWDLAYFTCARRYLKAFQVQPSPTVLPGSINSNHIPTDSLPTSTPLYTMVKRKRTFNSTFGSIQETVITDAGASRTVRANLSKIRADRLAFERQHLDSQQGM